ncbi:MAG: cellulase family glycosylhydrolase [Flavobacteriales bacterium]|nr:cellulase family glycosylhydrolase [Flavobacteriales bacterium]
MNWLMSCRRALRAGALLLALTPQLASGQLVTLEGRDFMLDGSVFYPLVMNYTITFASNTYGSGTDIYISPDGGYDRGVGGELECASVGECNAQLRLHFQKLVSMGFNTIRLIGAQAKMRAAGSRQFLLSVRHNTNSWADPSYSLVIETPSGFVLGASDQYFASLRNFIGVADDEGLKVILLVAGGEPPPTWNAFWDWNSVDRYAHFLERLGQELAMEPGLLAYDLWNEPGWTARGQGNYDNWSKSDVCDISARWYDSIRLHDADHLITVGGCNVDDMEHWDPSVIKLDFWSPHLYPQPAISGLSNTMNRYYSRLCWIGRNSPMPFLIGETGFSAEEDSDDNLDAPGNEHLDADPAHHQLPWMHGTAWAVCEDEQAEFAIASMDATRYYLGSGYSWWTFQNGRAANLSSGPDAYKENFYGLLKYGGAPCATCPGGLTPWADKQAVQAFTNYVLPAPPASIGTPPSSYSNWSMNSGPLLTTIYLRDQHGRPIADAAVKSIQEIETIHHTAGYNIHSIFTSDANGRVEIRRGHAPSGYLLKRVLLDIFSQGAKTIRYVAPQLLVWNPPALVQVWPEEMVIDIFRSPLKYELNIVGQSIACGLGSNVDLYAWDRISLSSVVVEQDGEAGGEVLFRARREIHVHGEFHAEVGSEVHIYPDRVFPKCEVGIGMDWIAQPETGLMSELDDSPKARTGEVELTFSKDQVSPSLTVRPNPGVFVIEVDIQNVWGEALLEILDPVGRVLRSEMVRSGIVSIGIGGLAEGQYYARLSDAGRLLVAPFQVSRR